MKQSRPAMLLAMLLVTHTVSAGNPLGVSGAVIFINIPFGGAETTRRAPSIGFDFDMPKIRAASSGGGIHRKSVVPLELELTPHGPYRVKIGGFYLDSLK